MLVACLPRCLPGDRLRAVRVYAVVSERMIDEALELFVDPQMAELMVENWNRDEPESRRRASRRAGRARDLGELATPSPAR